jgi:anti-anti-sigma factor
VKLAGEFDIAGRELADEVLARANGKRKIVLDLSDLEFIDSSGLQVLMRARGLLGREDRALAVVCPHGAVRKVFELSGCSDLFALFPSREAAVAALVQSG